MHSLTELNSWKELMACSKTNRLIYNTTSLKDSHPETLCTTEHISLDYGDQCLDPNALQLLFALAQECGVSKKINELITGHPVNITEGRPALHTALRATSYEAIWVDKHNIVEDVLNARETMRTLSQQIREETWLGHSGKPITDVVNIGIGGSFLGALFCTSALVDDAIDSIGLHFIAGFDPSEFDQVVRTLKPETTLFIVASKSFTTQESIINMKKAMSWMNQPRHLDKHFIAVTANTKAAYEAGIDHVIPIWNWVGGRFSSSSAINLITCIAIGYERFSEMLQGAHAMDTHFKNTQGAQNLPVLLALLGVWNINFLSIHNHLALVYLYALRHFVPYLQQLDMESNGKSLDNQGRVVTYATGPIVWGGIGDQIQHSFFQLLCQGTNRVAADLINVPGYDEMVTKVCGAHKLVLSNATVTTRRVNILKSSKTPVNLISLVDYSPRTLGALMALYEHKIFVQSVIWNINAFDQPGVELSK